MDETKKLAYETYLTGKAAPADELPMIVLLHFMGSNPNQIFELLLGDFGYPARVIAPYGPYRFEGQFSWFPESLYDEDENNQGKFIDGITKLLLENVERWEGEFSTRGKPIFLGVSQGGDICFTLACGYGDRFGLCLPVAGRLLAEEIIDKTNAGVVRIHHGEDDPIVPVARAREATMKLQSTGINVKLRAYEGVVHAVPLEMRKAIQEDISIAISG